MTWRIDQDVEARDRVESVQKAIEDLLQVKFSYDVDTHDDGILSTLVLFASGNAE
jgi:hypothetical protein